MSIQLDGRDSMRCMADRSKTVDQQLLERALLIWTVREVIDLARGALLLVASLVVVIKVLVAFI